MEELSQVSQQSDRSEKENAKNNHRKRKFDRIYERRKTRKSLKSTEELEMEKIEAAKRKNERLKKKNRRMLQKIKGKSQIFSPKKSCEMTMPKEFKLSTTKRLRGKKSEKMVNVNKEKPQNIKSKNTGKTLNKKLSFMSPKFMKNHLKGVKLKKGLTSPKLPSETIISSEISVNDSMKDLGSKQKTPEATLQSNKDNDKIESNNTSISSEQYATAENVDVEKEVPSSESISNLLGIEVSLNKDDGMIYTKSNITPRPSECEENAPVNSATEVKEIEVTETVQ